MSRINERISGLKEKGEGALISYVTAGDPDPSYTPSIVEAMIKGGADIIELGVPFSDPIADGPTIQAAAVRALKAGTKTRTVLRIVEEIRDRIDNPIILLSYYNPIFRMGLRSFFESCVACGIDGTIVPDLPIEEADEYKRLAMEHDVDTIFLAAPSTTDDRLKRIIRYTSGFLYLVSLFGVTGARERLQDLTLKLIRRTVPFTEGRVPLAVGFGISKPEHVRRILESGADGAIVGSGFVKIIERNLNNFDRMLNELKRYSAELKGATLHVKGTEKRRVSRFSR